VSSLSVEWLRVFSAESGDCKKEGLTGVGKLTWNNKKPSCR